MAARIRERISHTSLRTRLVLGLLALAAVGLLVLDLVSYTALTRADKRRLSQAIDALAEPLSKVPAVVVE